MAHCFAREGARIAITYRTNEVAAKETVAQIERDGGHALALPCDLADSTSIKAAVQTVTATWGDIGVLVLSASPAGGPNPRPLPFEEMPAREWQLQLRTEVEGAFSTVQAVLPSMRARGWGRIVMISASLVDRGLPGSAAYVASKTALHGLSRNLATELFRSGILCNVVAPGPTVTDRFLRVHIPDETRKIIAGKSREEIKQILNEQSATPRISTPEDVANAVVFLASAANGNTTGTVLNVSGP
jgi:3-oxoacyl-[acyl-carrier protein] reductase